jgi:hypothetical protein
MYIKIILQYCCLTAIVLLLSACDTPSKEEFINEAEKIASRLLDSMAEERYEDAVKLYDPRFFERIPPAEWQIILKRLNERFGSYRSRKMTASSVKHGFSTISTATTVLVYHVQYEKNYTVQKFTFMSDEKAENMTLVGHYIDFPEEQK